MGDSVVKIDEAVFLQRLKKLHDHFVTNRGNADWYGNAGTLLMMHGKPVESSAEEPHAVTLQKHLLGYEFPDTIMLLAGKTLTVHATGKKLDYLRGAQAKAAAGGEDGLSIELLPREKGADNAKNTAALVQRIKDAGGVVAKFADDHTAGSPAMDSWLSELAGAGVTVVDATRGADAALAVKDASALDQITRAGHLTARVARQALVKQMEAVIEDEEAGVTNESLSARVSTAADDLPKLGIKLDTDNFDFLLQPVVQSGGSYTLALTRPDLVPSGAPFSPDVVVFSQAMKYKAHAAFLARTYLVDPSPSQSRAYDAVLAAQAAIIDALRPGATVADAARAGQEVLMAAELPAEAKVSRNFGTGFGLRAGERHLALTVKNATVVEPGMVFNVLVGLSDIPIPDAAKLPAGVAMAKLKTYALLVGDTVIVDASPDKAPAVVTDKLPNERSQVVYSLAGDEEEEEEAEEEEDAGRGKGKGGKEGKGGSKKGKGGVTSAADYEAPVGIRSTRLAARKGEMEEDEAARRRREEHQAALYDKKREDARRRKEGKGAANAGAGKEDGDDLAHAPDIAAYAGPSELPRAARPNQIAIDKAKEAVLLPLFGSLVPFHVSTIKSVVKSEEGAKAFLRLNFYAPGAAPGKECSPAMQAAMLRHPESIYVRTLNFMSRDHRNMNNVVAMIKAMQKKIKSDREAEAQKAGLVEQQKLILTRDAKFPRLADLNMWPATSGRKTQGTLEAHSNGLRFISSKGERVDITYANIRHGIFQPCEAEHVVLIHFHLKHPIIIGKKKFKDVQFFTEVVEASQAIDGRKRSDFDADEVGEEERERRIIQEMNKAFKRFAERVEDVAERDPTSSFSRFDVPQRDLAFPGAPQREMVTLLPCSECLVSLVDKPPFVVTVSDVDHVHFERVTFTNKDFDMVFIYKEGVREKGEEEFVRVSSIPRAQIDNIKRWLDEVADLTYTEGTGNMNWKAIMEDFVRQPDFWDSKDEEGEEKPSGWDFLRDEAAEEEEEESEEESAYSESEDDADEDEEDLSDDDVVSEEDSEEDYEEEDESEGEDWEELEKKAERDDRKRKREEDEEDAKARAKYDKGKKKARRE